jgi:hypothetical protein
MKTNRFINLITIAFGLAAFPAATFSAICTVPAQTAAPLALRDNDLFSFAQDADQYPSNSANLPLVVSSNECISADLNHADSFSFQPAISSAGSCVGSGGSSGGGIPVVTSIPEPSTYAMLAGLGAFGLVAWRRKSPASGDSAIIR